MAITFFYKFVDKNLNTFYMIVKELNWIGIFKQDKLEII